MFGNLKMNGATDALRDVVGTHGLHVETGAATLAIGAHEHAEAVTKLSASIDNATEELHEIADLAVRALTYVAVGIAAGMLITALIDWAANAD